MRNLRTMVFCLAALVVIFPLEAIGEIDKPIVNSLYGFKIGIPKRWESQPLPPPTDYEAMGIGAEEAELYEEKKIVPVLINKGPQGCEFRLFVLDSPDMAGAIELAKSYFSTKGIKTLPDFEDVRNSCRKTKLKHTSVSATSWGGNAWIYDAYIANNENGSFLLIYIHLSTYKQYEKQIEESAKSFAWSKKEENPVNEPGDRRLDLPKGWALLETENYLIQYNETNTEKVKEFGKKIEKLHSYHEKVIAPDPQLEQLRPKKQTRKFIIKYFKNSKGFQEYGGDEGVYGAAAYYNPSRGEIAFYFMGWKKQTLGVLFHECTHQYLQEFVGGPRVRFHIATNEGLAEYFNGTVQEDADTIILGSKLPTSYQTVKRAIRDGSVLKMKEVLRWSQAQYYQLGRFAYDHGWALVYFLLHSDNKRYNEVLPIYFRTIQQKVFPALQALSEEGVDINSGGTDSPENRSEAWQILSSAQNDAMDKAFEGIDMDQFQKDFEDYYR
ncbi:MAG: hypothetical protein Kow00107_04330 [Planctomycetota bacterium]